MRHVCISHRPDRRHTPVGPAVRHGGGVSHAAHPYADWTTFHTRGQDAATTTIQRRPVEQRATTGITVMEQYEGAAYREELATISGF